MTIVEVAIAGPMLNPNPRKCGKVGGIRNRIVKVRGLSRSDLFYRKERITGFRMLLFRTNEGIFGAPLRFSCTCL